MTPYFIGVFGVLGGAVGSLILYVMYKNVKHKAELRALDYASLKERHKKEAAEKARLKDENASIRQELDNQRELVHNLRIASGDTAETNRALNQLFVMSKM